MGLGSQAPRLHVEARSSNDAVKAGVGDRNTGQKPTVSDTLTHVLV